MKIQIFDNFEVLSEAIADFIIDLVKEKPTATIVLTSGDTPKRAYQVLAKKARKEDFEQITIIGLDEWVGIGGENEGSCRFIVEENLLLPLGISTNNYTFFDALSQDLNAECKRIDELIFAKGGLDFIVVGVGMNGHIGLNEPGYSFDNYCHVTDLAPITVEVGQKYFNTSTPLTKGITVGLKHLLEAKTAMLIANGSRKAEVIHKTVSLPVSTDFPSTVFQSHKNGLIWVDKEAGKLLP